MVRENESPQDQQQPVRNPRCYRRKLTSFLCQEMLYEYVVDRLDKDRRADIDAFLPTDEPSQQALEDVRAGLRYSDRLARAELSEELIAKLRGSETVLSMFRKYLDWEEWSYGVRWSATALATSILIAGLVAVIPWEKLPRFKQKNPQTSIVLADIPKTAKPVASALSNKEDETDADHPSAHPSTQSSARSSSGSQVSMVETSGDEHDVETVKAAPQVAVAHGHAAAPAREVPTRGIPAGSSAARAAAPRLVPAERSSSASERDNVAVTTTEALDATDTSANEASVAIETSAVNDKKPSGFVFRAFMNVPNVEEITPELVAKLEELGGVKAGEVPLGWRRGDGSYFHFSLPESNQQKVLELLRAHGPVRISKDPHPRVMPSGQIRFILWVEPTEG